MTLHDFIFSRNLKYRIPRHLLFWIARATAFYIGLWGIYFGMPIETEDSTGVLNIISAGYIGSHVFFDMAYTYLIVYVLVPIFFRPKRYVQFWLLAIVYSGLVLFIKIFMGLQVAGATRPGPLMLDIEWGETVQFINSFGPPAGCVLFIAIRMLKNWTLNQQQKIKLVRANANAELEILKAQIHPHFLFNTLNNIYFFTVNGSFNATVLLDRLSAIINYMMNDCEATYVSLESELSMLRNYLELQGIRYGDRLQLNTQLPDLAGDQLVTPLLFIPFVENSFKHGASRILDGPYISLNIVLNGEYLHFNLINNKPLNESATSPTSGIGLCNVKKRLELLYPKNHSLEIDQTIDTFNVRLTIPVFPAQETGKLKSSYVM